MSYGPTPTTSAPASSSTRTSQSSQGCASGSYADAARKRPPGSSQETKPLPQPAQLPQAVHQRSTSASKGRRFTLNPNAETFIPRSQRPHGDHQHSNRPQDISVRQAKASQESASTPQSSQYCASGSYANAAKKPPSAPNREAKALAPQAQLPKGVHQHANNSSNISSQQASAYQRPTPRTLHPEAKPSPPEAIKKEISSAFEKLKNQNFTDAEEAFRVVLQKYQDRLSLFKKQNTIMGLARALKEQTNEKQLEACSLLEALRLDGKCNEFGASVIHNLDLYLSLCEEALGRHFAAETRLLRLRQKRTDADEKTLCQPSGFYTVDITNARLWQLMGKHALAETLLLKIKEELIKEPQWRPYTSAAKKRRKYLDDVNVSLMRLWQLMKKYQLAEDLLLDMSGKHPDDDEDILCTPTEDGNTNLALVRLWQAMDKHIQAERLLLKMSSKHPEDSEDILCRPFGNHGIDLALARLWIIMGKHNLAERLLLNIIGKSPCDSEEFLCSPAVHDDIYLALVRLWQTMGKHKHSAKLLLNMSGKRPGATEEELCRPSGNRIVDLTLARLWGVVGKPYLTERLLLNMSGKRPGASEESLCKPCGRRDIDITLVRHWEIMGKYHLCEQLLLNMRGKDPDDSEAILCEPCGHDDIDLPQAILWQMMDKPERVERLLLNMSSKHPGDDEDSLCRPSGNHDIDLTLARCWRISGKFKRAERLLKRCCELYHSKEFELALLIISAGQEGFMEVIKHYPDSANTLLANSIHYFNLACQQIIQDTPESGQDNLHKALEFVESALQKYPPSAGVLSQKAHCLRMLGRSEQQWREWFDKADAFDPGRAYKAKTHFWRNREAAALQKLSNLKE